MTSCERVQSAMLPTATRVLELGRDLEQLEKVRSDDEDSAAARQRMASLKSDASEIRARVQGCLDVGEALKVDGELKQALHYYDTACEFSLLVEAAGEAVPGLESISERGCAASKAARAELPGRTEFSPQLFTELLKPQRKASGAAQAQTQEDGMVFSEGDL